MRNQAIRNSPIRLLQMKCKYFGWFCQIKPNFSNRMGIANKIATFTRALDTHKKKTYRRYVKWKMQTKRAIRRSVDWAKTHIESRVFLERLYKHSTQSKSFLFFFFFPSNLTKWHFIFIKTKLMKFPLSTYCTENIVIFYHIQYERLRL